MTFSSSESNERLRERIADYREEVADIEAAISRGQKRVEYVQREIAELESELHRRASTRSDT